MIDNNNQMIDELKDIIYQIEMISKKDKKTINDRNQLMEWWNLFWRKAKEVDIRSLYSILDELPVTFVLDFLPKKGEVDSELLKRLNFQI